jgi:hypothetical protein
VSEEDDDDDDFELLAFALSAMPPTAATPAVAPMPMTTVLRFTALCFTVLPLVFPTTSS